MHAANALLGCVIIIILLSLLPMQHIAELRADEDSEACWYVLPDRDDEDVDWFNFVIEIEGPVSADLVSCGRGAVLL